MSTQLAELDTGQQVRRPGRWGTVLYAVERVELAVGGLLLLLILVLVMMQALSRVTPLPSQVWTGEIARFSLIWLAFALAGYLMGREEHIKLDAIDHVLPKVGKQIVHGFSLLVVAATAFTFAYEGYDLFSSGSPIKSPAAGIPLGWIYAIPTVGLFVTGLRALMLALIPSTRPVPVPSAPATQLHDLDVVERSVTEAGQRR